MKATLRESIPNVIALDLQRGPPLMVMSSSHHYLKCFVCMGGGALAPLNI